MYGKQLYLPTTLQYCTPQSITRQTAVASAVVSGAFFFFLWTKRSNAIRSRKSKSAPGVRKGDGHSIVRRKGQRAHQHAPSRGNGESLGPGDRGSEGGEDVDVWV